MEHLYGNFADSQIEKTKKSIRSSIYFLLLCVDSNTSYLYPNIDINEAFDNLLYKLDGFNSLLKYPQVIVDIMCLLKSAQNLYNSENFKYKVYRKLILDAGSEVLKIGEVS